MNFLFVKLSHHYDRVNKLSIHVGVRRLSLTFEGVGPSA